MVFPVIAAAFSAAAAWIGSLGVVAQIAIRVVAAVALSAIGRALTEDPKLPQSRTRGGGIRAQMQDGADVPRSFILGRYATAGSIVWHRAWEGDPDTGDVARPWYVRVTAISDMPCAGLAGIIINDKPCTILWDEYNEDRGWPIAEYQRESSLGDRYYAYVKFYDGTQEVADPYLLRIQSDKRPWTQNHIGRGVAYAITTFRYRKNLWQGMPSVKYVVDGLPIHDPIADETTATTNTALQIGAILNGLTWNGAPVYGPQSTGAGALDAAELAAQVAICGADLDGAAEMTAQERIDTFGADIIPPTYQTGTEITVDTPIADALEDLMAGCVGKVSDAGDRLRLLCGPPPAPVFSFTDDDWRTSATRALAPFFALAETVNAVEATYPSPADSWSTQDAPPLYVSEYEAEDDNRRLTTSVALSAVPYPEQVQRVLRAELNEARRARRHTGVLKMKWCGLEPGDVGAWTSAANQYDGKLFRVDRVAHQQNGDVAVDLTEVDPTDYDWQPGNDFVPVESVPLDDDPAVALPGNGWSVAATVLQDAAGKDRRAAISLQWTDSTENVEAVLWRVRLAASGAIAASGSVADVDAGAVVIAEGLLPATDYEVSAQYVTEQAEGTTWTVWMPVTTPDVRLAVEDIAEEVFDKAKEDAQDILDGWEDATFDPIIEDVHKDILGLDIQTRSASGAIATLTEQMLWSMARLGEAEREIAGAGIYTDPETGRVELAAWNDLHDLHRDVTLQLDAANAEIALRATYDDLTREINKAVIDPSQIPVFDQIEGRLTNVELGLDAANAEIAARVTHIEFNGLEDRVSVAETEILANANAITLKVNTAEFTPVEQRLTVVEQELSTYDGAKFSLSLIDQRRLAQLAEDATIADLEGVIRDIENRETDNAQVAAYMQDIHARVSEEGVSTATKIEDLATGVDGAVSRIRTEERVRAEEGLATALRIDGLAARADDLEDDQSGLAQALDITNASVDANGEAIEAQAGRSSSIIAGVGNRGDVTDADALLEAVRDAEGLTELQGALAAVQADVMAYAKEQFEAVAQQMLQVTTSLNGNVTSVREVTRSVDGVKGLYSLTIDNNGHVSGFGLNSELLESGAVESAFSVIADRFSVTSPDGEVSPFVIDIVDGVAQVVIDGNILLLGSVDTRGLAIGAVTEQVSSFTVGSINADASESADPGRLMETLTIESTGLPVRVEYSAQIDGIGNNEAQCIFKLVRDGAEIFETRAATVWTGGTNSVMWAFRDTTVGAGVHTYELYGRRTNQSTDIYDGTPRLAVRNFLLEEVKR